MRHLAPRSIVSQLVAAATAVAACAALAGCGSESANAQAVRDDGSVDLSKVTLTVGDQKLYQGSLHPPGTGRALTEDGAAAGGTTCGVMYPGRVTFIPLDQLPFG